MADLPRVAIPLEERHRKAKAAIAELESERDEAQERLNGIKTVLSLRAQGLSDNDVIAAIELVLDDSYTDGTESS